MHVLRVLAKQACRSDERRLRRSDLEHCARDASAGCKRYEQCFHGVHSAENAISQSTQAVDAHSKSYFANFAKIGFKLFSDARQCLRKSLVDLRIIPKGLSSVGSLE